MNIVEFMAALAVFNSTTKACDLLLEQGLITQKDRKNILIKYLDDRPTLRDQIAVRLNVYGQPIQ